MTRVFSGIKPTGHLTLGNYLGAVRQWAAADQHRAESLFCVVDLHALTVDHDPARVRRLSRLSRPKRAEGGRSRSGRFGAWRRAWPM